MLRTRIETQGRISHGSFLDKLSGLGKQDLVAFPLTPAYEEAVLSNSEVQHPHTWSEEELDYSFHNDISLYWERGSGPARGTRTI